MAYAELHLSSARRPVILNWNPRPSVTTSEYRFLEKLHTIPWLICEARPSFVGFLTYVFWKPLRQGSLSKLPETYLPRQMFNALTFNFNLHPPQPRRRRPAISRGFPMAIRGLLRLWLSGSILQRMPISPQRAWVFRSMFNVVHVRCFSIIILFT
jgi:hypothetical protein